MDGNGPAFLYTLLCQHPNLATERVKVWALWIYVRILFIYFISGLGSADGRAADCRMCRIDVYDPDLAMTIEALPHLQSQNCLKEKGHLLVHRLVTLVHCVGAKLHRGEAECMAHPQKRKVNGLQCSIVVSIFAFLSLFSFDTSVQFFSPALVVAVAYMWRREHASQSQQFSPPTEHAPTVLHVRTNFLRNQSVWRGLISLRFPHNVGHINDQYRRSRTPYSSARCRTIDCE